MWSGLGACILMVIAIAFHLRWDYGWIWLGQPPGNTNRYILGIAHGSIIVGGHAVTSLAQDLGLRQESGPVVQQRYGSLRWRPAPASEISAEMRYGLVLPLWIPYVLIAIPTGLLVRAERRERRQMRAHLCAKCGYDRRGLVDGAVCPECGEPGGMRASRTEAAVASGQ